MKFQCGDDAEIGGIAALDGFVVTIVGRVNLPGTGEDSYIVQLPRKAQRLHPDGWECILLLESFLTLVSERFDFAEAFNAVLEGFDDDTPS